jgi:hypothetical protein
VVAHSAIREIMGGASDSSVHTPTQLVYHNVLKIHSLCQEGDYGVHVIVEQKGPEFTERVVSIALQHCLAMTPPQI